MRKLCAAVLFFLGLATAALAQQSVVVPATMFSVPITGGVTSIIATGQPGKSIYVTAVDIIPTIPATFRFIQGTGALCGTNPGPDLTGSLIFSAGQVYLKGSGNGALWVLLPGNSLCIFITAGGPAPGSLAYAIF